MCMLSRPRHGHMHVAKVMVAQRDHVAKAIACLHACCLDIQERPSKFVCRRCMQIKCIVAAQLCQNDGLRSVMDLITNTLYWASRSRRQHNQYPLTVISLSLNPILI
ncbi:hypothetical protein ACJW30_08G171100 [Castanea mollissima]